jgi:hypothetical protein
MLNRKSKEVISLHHNSFRFDNFLSKRTSVVSADLHIQEGEASQDSVKLSTTNWNGFSIRKIFILLTSLFMFFTATSLVMFFYIKLLSYTRTELSVCLFLGVLHFETYAGTNAEVLFSSTTLR